MATAVSEQAVFEQVRDVQYRLTCHIGALPESHVRYSHKIMNLRARILPFASQLRFWAKIFPIGYKIDGGNDNIEIKL